MHEFRDDDVRRHASPSSSDPERSAGSAQRLREIGELHFHAATYSSAVDYFSSALRAVPFDTDVDDARDLTLQLRMRIADCRRLQGYFQDAADELELCAELVRDDPIETACIEVRLARVRQSQGQYDEAIRLARDAFVTLSLSDRHQDVGIAQITLGITHACIGQVVKAEEFFQDALATYRRIDDTVSQAHVLNNLAILAKGACRWHRAVQLYDRAEALLQKSGATYETVVLLLNKGILYRKMGLRAEAHAAALRGMKLARSRGDQADLARLSLLLGQICTEDGRTADAEKHLLEAKVLSERLDMGREQALADEFLGDLMRASGRLDQAETNYLLAEERGRRISDANDVLAEVLRRRGELALERGDARGALELAARGLELVDAVGEEYERGFLHRTRAAALELLDDLAGATAAYEEALEVFRKGRLVPQLAETLVDLAELHLASGGQEQALLAKARLNEALELEDESGTIDACSIQFAIARTELALGRCDEAMMALYELERLACHSGGDLDDAVEDLRRSIEEAMAEIAAHTSPSYQLLTELPELVEEEDFPRSDALGVVLRATAERLGAERGFVALRHGIGRGRLEVLATEEIARTRARELAVHALGLLKEQADGRARVWSQTPRDADWQDLLAEKAAPLRSAVAFRVTDAECGVEALFYFDADHGPDGRLPFEGDSIAVASTSVELLRGAVLRAAREERGIDARVGALGPFERVITNNESMMEVLDLCAKVAPSPYTVLLTGQTGTGKGLLARVIHELSPRSERPLVAVNCAAIPESLLESELFGHVRGAFTGAERAREGLMRTADGGTLFLDEVGKMPLPMQAKLLHFLDDRTVRPVGASAAIEVDVRVICASKRDLKKMVESGEFLEDLYYRLLDFPIAVPSLHERGDDVLLLAETFVRRACRELQRPALRLTRSVVTKLRAYDWPGNVRELEKVLTRAVVLAAGDDRIRDKHLPDAVREGARLDATDQVDDALRPLKEQVSDLERQVLQTSLDRLGWNRSEAARQLKISYPTLLQKIRLYKLKPS